MTRKQDLERMVVTLKAWAGQIADLQAEARTAGPKQQLVMRQQLLVLRERRRAYQAQLENTQGTSAAVFRDMQLGAARMADEFRQLYAQAAG